MLTLSRNFKMKWWLPLTLLLRQHLDKKLPVFLITTEHSRDQSTWTLSMLDDQQGYLFHGERTAQLLEGVYTQGVTRLEKTRDDSWFGTDLEIRVRNHGVDRVVLTGVSTHSCIAQTAIGAYMRNIRAAIITDAVADENPSFEKNMLKQLSQARQSEMLTMEQILEQWANL